MPSGCRACTRAGGENDLVLATGTDTHLEFDEVYIANNTVGGNASWTDGIFRNLFILGAGSTTQMARTRIVGNTVAADGRVALA